MSTRKKTIMTAGAWGLSWEPPGAIAGHFHASDAAVRFINGPVGSGKSASVLLEILFRAMMQQPSPRDGVRYFKVRVVRNTMANLYRTTIPSWWQWMPPNVGKWAEEPWPSHEIDLKIKSSDPDDPTSAHVRLMVEFVALGENRIEDMMRGWEGTAVVLEELDTLPKGVVEWCFGRVAQRRFPPQRDGGPSWVGVWGNLNAPEEDNWTYEQLWENEHRDVGRFVNALQWELFIQPGGRDPDAENLTNLGEGSYELLASQNSSWWVSRFVDNRPGFSRKGKPVYEHSYVDRVHVSAQRLPFDARLPLIIGGDAGKHPAALLCQPTDLGQLRVLGEVWGDNVSARPFARQLLTYIARRLPELAALILQGYRVIGWGDPSAGWGTETEESTWLEIMTDECGFTWRPAPVPDNNIAVRLSAVEDLLQNPGPEGQRQLILSGPDCRMLRAGFNSAYRYARIAGPSGRYHDVPDKHNNPYPDLHDALQYAALGAFGVNAMLGRPSMLTAGAQAYAIDDDEHRFNDAGTWVSGRELQAIMGADGRYSVPAPHHRSGRRMHPAAWMPSHAIDD